MTGRLTLGREIILPLTVFDGIFQLAAVAHRINLTGYIIATGQSWLNYEASACSIIALPYSWGKQIWKPGTPGWRSLKFETIEYAHESHSTRTGERLRCRGPAETVNYRPLLSSMRAPHNGNPQLSKDNLK
jgi:hypothetical protein